MRSFREPHHVALCLLLLGLGHVLSIPPTPTETSALASSLAGTLIAYDVSGDPQPTCTVNCGATGVHLWSYLQAGPSPLVEPSIPAVYVQAEDANDIVKALQFAFNHSLKTAVLGAGHQVVGVQLLPGGVTIDTSTMRNITVDPTSETAYVQPGALTIDILEAGAPYDLLFPTGHLNSVGIAGVALGGGLALGQTLWGNSVDSVLGIDVVSTWLPNPADWDIVRVDADSYPDLFWGLLGGGSMLVTAVGFELQLHPTPPEGLLTTLTAVFPLPEAVSAMAWYSEWHQTAPFELQSAFTMVTTPMGPAAAIGVTNFDPENSTAVNEAMQAFGEEALQQGAIAVTPSVDPVTDNAGATQALFESPGIAYYINDRFLDSIPEDLVASLLELFENVTSIQSLILIEPGFSATGLQNNETAFGFRNTWSVWVWPFWKRSAEGAAVDGDARHIAWAKRGGEILDLYGEGHYLNMNRFDTPDSAQTCFPAENWARLQTVKAQYDPHNLFRPLDYYRTDAGNGDMAVDADYYTGA